MTATFEPTTGGQRPGPWLPEPDAAGGPAVVPSPSPADGPESIDGTKAKITQLFQALEAGDVRYCHWKSNVRLAATLAGREDIDLLVDRRDRDRFHAILLETGFKIARSLAGEHPGVFHAVALDQPSAELVHLHVYFQLVSGDSLVKNYRFPVEHQLLAHARILHGVRVPIAEAELLLFALRIGLKHVSPIEIVKVNRSYREVTAELRFLGGPGTAERAEQLLADWFPTLDPPLFRRLLTALDDRRALVRRVVLGWTLAWRLRHLRRLGTWRAAALRVRQVAGKVVARIRRRRARVPLEGGAIVALVGPKGLGKSTLTRELGRRLGRNLAVMPIHAGKPPPTLLSAVPRLFIPLARILLSSERRATYETPERQRSKSYSLIHVLHMALLAYDRRVLLFRALRAATAGTIVISDRYPSDRVGATDSSRFDDDALARCRPGLKRRLMSMERRCYAGLPRPRVVLRLEAPLDLALERDAVRGKKGGPDPAAIRRRWRLETGGVFVGVPVVAVPAQGGLEETVRAAMTAAWEVL